MKKIYFIRHAEPDRTVEDEFTRPLSFLGQEQAKQLALYLNNKEIDYIFCSPYLRTRQTAHYISEQVNVPVNEIFELHERIISLKWIPTLNFTEYSMKQWENRNFKLDTGESLSEALERFRKGLDKIWGIVENESTVVIVTHATVISLFLNSLDSSYGFEKFQKMTTPDIYYAEINKANEGCIYKHINI